MECSDNSPQSALCYSLLFVDSCEHSDVYMFQVRRRVRPLFLSSQLLKFIYDSITFVATRIAIAYLGFPFLVLELQPVLQIYRLFASLLLAESHVVTLLP